MNLNVNLIIFITIFTQIFSGNKIITNSNSNSKFYLHELEYIGTARVDGIFRTYVLNYIHEYDEPNFGFLYNGKTLQILAMHYILGRYTYGLTPDIIVEYANYINRRSKHSELYKWVAKIVSFNDLEWGEMEELHDITDIRANLSLGNLRY